RARRSGRDRGRAAGGRVGVEDHGGGGGDPIDSAPIPGADRSREGRPTQFCAVGIKGEGRGPSPSNRRSRRDRVGALMKSTTSLRLTIFISAIVACHKPSGAAAGETQPGTRLRAPIVESIFDGGYASKW